VRDKLEDQCTALTSFLENMHGDVSFTTAIDAFEAWMDDLQPTSHQLTPLGMLQNHCFLKRCEFELATALTKVEKPQLLKAMVGFMKLWQGIEQKELDPSTATSPFSYISTSLSLCSKLLNQINSKAAETKRAHEFLTQWSSNLVAHAVSELFAIAKSEPKPAWKDHFDSLKSHLPPQAVSALEFWPGEVELKNLEKAAKDMSDCKAAKDLAGHLPAVTGISDTLHVCSTWRIEYNDDTQSLFLQFLECFGNAAIQLAKLEYHQDPGHL
jgi:hypothetical protein